MSSRATTVIESVCLSTVWRALGGGELRRGRGRAFWRRGAGWSVSSDDRKGTWYDHARGEGGGMVDLVVQVRGGSRQDALRWLADVAGVDLEDRPLTPEERAAWAAERRALERDLPAARLWRRAAIDMGEETLTLLKAALFDPTLPAPDVGEIADWERRVARWRALDGAELVKEYREWRADRPALTGAMVKAAKLHEVVDGRACDEYFRLLEKNAA